MDCVFCKIVNGEIPSYTIYEDELVKCFLDINPSSNGHMLIIPKKHFKDIFDIDDDILLHIKDIAKDMTKKEEVLNIQGMTLIQNNGDAEEVKHFHLHLKPYYKEKQEIIPVESIYNKLKY